MKTQASIFIPCLRPRFKSVSSYQWFIDKSLTIPRAIAEIETGLKCGECKVVEWNP
jgi:hypothetical protein